jgi:hypothetical protein
MDEGQPGELGQSAHPLAPVPSSAAGGAQGLGAIEEEDLGASLRAACEAGDFELVRGLLVRGANVSALAQGSSGSGVLGAMDDGQAAEQGQGGGLRSAAAGVPALAQGSSGSGVLGAMDDGQAAEQAQGGGLRSAAAGAQAQGGGLRSAAAA